MTKAEDLKELLQNILRQTESEELSSSEEVINRMIQQLQA